MCVNFTRVNSVVTQFFVLKVCVTYSMVFNSEVKAALKKMYWWVYGENYEKMKVAPRLIWISRNDSIFVCKYWEEHTKWRP